MLSLLFATIVALGAKPTSVVTSDAPFDAAALIWSGEANLRIRVNGEWITPAIDGDITEHHATAITHFGLTKSIEYAFDGPVSNVSVTLFAPGGLKRAATHGYVTRTEWGCPDGESAPMWPPQYTVVTHAVVHHTAGSNDLTDWAAEVLNIWNFHTFSNGWGDIGYNFLIDPNGVIYEGRAGGSGAIGAHFSCRNTNTVGIALLGTFSTVPPTQAALTSLERLLSQLCQQNKIDPTAMVYHP